MHNIQKVFIFSLLFVSLFFTACNHEEEISKKETRVLLKGEASQKNHELARSHFEEGEYAKALAFDLKQLEEDLKYHQEESLEIALDYNNIGLDYDMLREYKKALLYYQKAMKIDEVKLDENSSERGTTYYNIASVYDALEEYDLAISYYEKALAVDEEVYHKYDENLLASYEKLAIIYPKISKPNLALKYAKKALACKEAIYGEEDAHTKEARVEVREMMEKMK